MRHAGLSPWGRVATRLACWFTPPYYGRKHLAKLGRNGFVAPNAAVYHSDLRLGGGVFIDDHVLIFQDSDGGFVELQERVHVFRGTIIQTGTGGSVTIGAHSFLQPRCQLSAYEAPIHIGCRVQIAPNCAFYPYDHGIEPDELISKQPLRTKGGIIVEDGAWLGFGVIVLDGVRIGKGAVIGAGSVVNQDVPDGAIAVGVPAKVVRMRAELAKELR